MTSFRKERVADLLLSFLGGEIRHIHDPRAQFITVTGVKVSADLKIARVYWSVLGGISQDKFSNGKEIGALDFPEEEEIEEVGKVLTNAKGFLKRQIGLELKLRYTPELIFQYDESLARGSRIEALLRKI